MDPEMNKLLKWSITNSDASKGAEDEGNAVDASKSQITPELISKLFGGGPSDADLMKAAIEVIKDPETDLENKLVAFDNFEQLIEGIDNAMNIQSLNLWPDLVSLLEHEETDIRRMAAWSVGTAVQNNPKTQAHFVDTHSFPKLVSIATTDPNPATRKKGVYALSSAVRNHQPSLDELLKSLPAPYQNLPADYKQQLKDEKKSEEEQAKPLDASNMDFIDFMMDKLRTHTVDASA
ncbi:Armadillo-like helical [Penicillium soppii]|uniref:Armadillo-like helical n=1 Tax=Penicillium soppii TaxID=69789 RepID=UPI0025489362|nr:Armadillo-like helical [Penicillium soppii]KAJ5882598.1 Armadillo-like helical [Penicillium soppii]